jgi:LacI family transcriptional regulator, galactose operon repressor
MYPYSMTNLPTISDIALKAGTSTATVDRVLNQRRAVSERTKQRVLSAAVAIGYLPATAIGPLQDAQPKKIALLLPRGTNPYLVELNEIARSFVEKNRFDAQIKSYFINSFDPDELATALRQFAQNSDGVIFMAVDHPKVRAAIDDIAAAGKRVITLISDISNSRRHAYVGIDNFAAGRTAAQILGRFNANRSGRVALIAASRVYRAHSEREVGFLGFIEEQFPLLTVSATREGHDDRDENYRHMRALLDKHPNIIGLYNVGGASDGIGRALRESGRAQDITFVGHGLTPDTRAMLLDGTMDVVITQNPTTLFEAAIATACGKPDQAVAMELYLSENLPLS